MVARIGDEATDTCFLKLLNRQKDPERRKRFFRETSALATYSHPNIPRPVETNAFHYTDNEFKLYLVSEFIAGPTITDQVSQRGTLAFDRALALTTRLAEIVGYCHSQGGIHRDIKPDNIILRDGRLDDPVLVDFGLSFNQAETIDFATEDSQELGNRFLRVPELSSGSQQRRDFRTDLTFVAAIFYYAYVGIPPAVLEDAEGRLPHQRPIATQRLAELDFSHALRLRSFFDRAFQPVLAHRFTTVDEMRMALKELSEVKNGGSSRSADDILVELQRAANSDAAERRHRNGEIIGKANTEVSAVRDEIIKLFGSRYWMSQANWEQRDAESGSSQIGFTLAYSGARFLPTFRYRLIGDELLISVSEESDGTWTDLLRTSRETPVFDETFKERIKKVFAEGLSRMGV